MLQIGIEESLFEKSLTDRFKKRIRDENDL